MTRRLTIFLLLAVALTACTLKEEATPTPAGGAPAATPPAVPAPPDVAAPPPEALKTTSGLASKMLRVGLGRVHPGPTSTVIVQYTGWKTDGTMFDTSIYNPQPATFRVDQVVAGWTEGLQLMVAGEKRRFWIPGALGYDNLPDPMGRNPKGMLVFDVELLDVK